MAFFDSVRLWYLETTEQWSGRAPVGAKRSSGWPKVQRDHLKLHPACACCGGTKNLRVHHVQPFHLKPELELEPSNLITLCESGRFGINCHLLVGHLGNWRRWNPLVRVDAMLWAAKLSGRLSSLVRRAAL